MNDLRHRSVGAVLAAALALAACSAPAPKPAAPPEAATPKLGVVGLVSEVKERGVSRDNWKGAIGGLFSNDTEQEVTATRYEVTVFYDDSTTGVVIVEQNPNLAPGARVRVTGNRIDPVRR